MNTQISKPIVILYFNFLVARVYHLNITYDEMVRLGNFVNYFQVSKEDWDKGKKYLDSGRVWKD